ncbi:conserved hypothetical protein [Pediculus humanus corporis]|uniref:Uncharacterized protein n=1 Tax=Pediculus humanus subsp. corporis TaxID=121224 RepID=E0VQN6_PEDHC|nr:uncharacterized protein Phum_PHUM380470 [Pediculus humanus corporis]EEB15692.1 conserved hypothetical protein [Pediculus humanus corporis]
MVKFFELLNLINIFSDLGGNQRELARAKNQKKQLEIQKKKGACDKSSNAGLTLEQRKHRDAELMREKQRRKQEAMGNNGNTN